MSYVVVIDSGGVEFNGLKMVSPPQFPAPGVSVTRHYVTFVVRRDLKLHLNGTKRYFPEGILPKKPQHHQVIELLIYVLEQLKGSRNL
jgi:hypothetical protein